MKYIVALALMLNLGVANVYAERSRQDGFFGNFRAQRGQSTAARHDGKRLEKPPETVYWAHLTFRRVSAEHTFSALAKQLLLGRITYFFKGGRRALFGSRMGAY